MSDASGFTVPDGTQTSTDLNTLFGVNQAVGQAPILLHPGGSRLTSIGTLHETPPESTTLTEALSGFYGMDPNALANLQRQLYSGGFFDNSYYTKAGKRPLLGVPDEDSFAAFKKAALRAARSGQPLGDVISTPGTAAGGQPATAKATVQLTNPTDLRAVAKAVYQQTVGRYPDPAFVDHFVAAYHDAETKAGTGAFDSSQTAGGGTYTAAPDPKALAEEMARQADPAAAQAMQTAAPVHTFEGLVKGG